MVAILIFYALIGDLNLLWISKSCSCKILPVHAFYAAVYITGFRSIWCHVLSHPKMWDTRVGLKVWDLGGGW